MASLEVVIPRLGESVIEVIITKWLKNEGDQIETEEALVEIATDKVDSEIVSTASGKLSKKLFKEGAIVAVGTVFAIIDPAGEATASAAVKAVPDIQPVTEKHRSGHQQKTAVIEPQEADPTHGDEVPSGSRYYSPLVRSIAQQESLSVKELDSIHGTGKDDRLTKQDILEYLKLRKSWENPAEKAFPSAVKPETVIPVFTTGEDRIIEMDRVRQLIANHLIKSVQTSPHVTSFIEVDMGKIVEWREKNKDSFQKKYGEKLTFTPIFIEAIAKAVRDFPMINVSVDGTKIIIHSKVNVGMAVALPSNNLIVPVVRDAGNMNLLGISKAVNDLANRARNNKLVPDEIAGGTISLTNLGSFGTIMGTPIINQPQTAIIAVGAIKKRPVVIESDQGDMIAIRPVMICSITFDHRVIDGALGGRFLNRLAQYLEQFDNTQTI
ncbi:MAG: dihydrolipoamide acetyltransferase family protein [Bacteroidetes bacterium]|nr:dihydrolipoamide acetyltransferase family protein [Bacteroidota bacterium]